MTGFVLVLILAIIVCRSSLRALLLPVLNSYPLPHVPDEGHHHVEAVVVQPDRGVDGVLLGRRQGIDGKPLTGSDLTFRLWLEIRVQRHAWNEIESVRLLVDVHLCEVILV